MISLLQTASGGSGDFRDILAQEEAVKTTKRWSAFLLFVLFIASAQLSAMAPPTAESLLADAVKTAKAQDKVVLVHFGASWCSWCKRLDEMILGPELGKLFADHFVIVHLTVQESDNKKALENPGAEALMKAEGADKAGVPVF